MKHINELYDVENWRRCEGTVWRKCVAKFRIKLLKYQQIWYWNWLLVSASSRWWECNSCSKVNQIIGVYSYRLLNDQPLELVNVTMNYIKFRSSPIARGGGALPPSCPNLPPSWTWGSSEERACRGRETSLTQMPAPQGSSLPPSSKFLATGLLRSLPNKKVSFRNN
jgi:hypothetical protein